jgi:hypothetical protein
MFWNTISGFKLLLFCQAWNDIAMVFSSSLQAYLSKTNLIIVA